MLGLLAFITPAKADLILTVEHAIAPAGTKATIVFSIASTSTDLLAGYSLPFDINGDGAGLPAGLSMSATPITNNNMFTTATFITGGTTFDGAAQGSGGPSVLIAGAPQTLFELNVDIDNAAPEVTSPIHLLATTFPPAELFSFYANGFSGYSSIPVSIGTNGSLTVTEATATAVPEPAQLITMFMGMGLVGMILLKRSRPATSSVA